MFSRSYTVAVFAALHFGIYVLLWTMAATGGVYETRALYVTILAAAIWVLSFPLMYALPLVDNLIPGEAREWKMAALLLFGIGNSVLWGFFLTWLANALTGWFQRKRQQIADNARRNHKSS